ncbi:PAS domain-containing protein [Desulfonema magnum]|uniref:PAS domain-containing protein n=1 Tax=Desulfonema magnum TaxID=45655 RepID=A0A975BNC7_9BACT|nr:PAS domain-containing protein [Desulfonema magnum]
MFISSDNEKRPSIFSFVFIIITITLILIAATIIHSINIHRETVNMITKQFNRQQSILAGSVAKQIETFLKYIANDLNRLSVHPDVVKMEPGALGQMRAFHIGIPRKTSLRRLDKEGMMRFICPDEKWRKNLIGRDYSGETYFQQAKKTKDILISGMITNEIGEMRIRVVKPIYMEDEQGKLKFNGIIMGSFDPDTLSLFVSPIVSGNTGYAWLMNEDGIFLSHYEKAFVGQDAFKVRLRKNPDLSYDTINHIQKKMIFGKQGQGRYVTGWHREEKKRTEKFIAYKPVRAFNKNWSIAVCAPVQEVEGSMRKSFRSDQYALGFIIFILIIGGVCSFTVPYRWSRILQREIDIRKQAEAALGESKKFSASLITAMKDGLCVLDKNGVLVDVNPSFCRMTGFSREELVGTGLPHIYWDEELREETEREFQKILSGNFEEFEFTFKRKNGECFPVIVSPSWIRDDKKNVINFLANIKGIEKRKQVENALKASEERLRILIEKIADGIIIADINGMVQFANPAAEVLFDKKADKLVGRAFSFSLATDDTIKIEIHRANGETGVAEMRVVGISWDGNPAYLASLRDITDRMWAAALEVENARLEAAILERKRAEESVKIAYRELNQIFQSAGDGMCVTDRNFNMLKVNKRFEKIFGIRKTDAINKKCYEVFGFDICKTSKCPMTEIFSGEELVQRDVEQEHPEGSQTLSITVTPLRNSDDELIGIIHNLKDLSERFQIEKALAESEARYRTIFENTGIATMIIEENMTISMINQEFENLTGYSKKEIHDKQSWKKFFIRDNLEQMERYHYLRRSNPGNAPRKYETKLIDRNGNLKDVCLTVAMIPETQKSIVSFLNISELRRTKKALQDNLEKLQEVMKDTIEAMALTIEKRDLYTAGHQRHVADLACAIAEEMGLSPERIEGIRMAGIVHDLGKIRVPASILSKPARLTEHEFGIIKDHPQVAYDILKKIDFPWPVAQMVLQHHEKIDGSGYPRGLSDKEILLEAKILTVADVVEAIASHRPYRPALGIEKALEEISQHKGKFYDPQVADACLRLFTEKRFAFD